MIDNAAYAMVPGNVTGLFRRLNGSTMPDILDTLDALWTQKSFAPNPNVYDAELRAAGIFVARMVVAMSAVLHKNSGNVDYAKFSSAHLEALAKLPKDQQEAISQYVTGKAEALAPQKLVEQYLNWAWRGVGATLKLLPKGAFNRNPGWNSYWATRQAKNETGSNPKASALAEAGIRAQGGNCDEHSAVAYVELVKMGVHPVHRVSLLDADHAFVLIGNGPIQFLEEKDLSRWGPTVVVCDAWDRSCFVATEIPNKLHSYKAPFRAQVYDTTVTDWQSPL